MRSDIKTFNIAAGQYSFSADDLYLGSVPVQLIVTLISSKNFNGDLKKILSTSNISIATI